MQSPINFAPDKKSTSAEAKINKLQILKITKMKTESINKTISCYVSGDEHIDNHTIIFNESKRFDVYQKCFFYDCIAASYNGVSVFQHSVCQKTRHLGKKVLFEDLDINLQRMILNEL